MKRFDGKYFNLIKQLSIVWYKIKGQRTWLGFFWSFLNPLIISLTLFFIFRNQNHTGNIYFIYILIGTIVWNFIASSIQSATTIIPWRREIVKNLTFPKETLIFGQIGVHIIEHFFEILIIFGFIFVTKIGFSIHLLLLPIVFIVELIIILGVALCVGLISVWAQDIEYIWATIARLGLFLAPIFYMMDSLSDRLRFVVNLNPATQIIIFYRDVLIYHQMPNINIMIILFILGSMFLFLIFYLFKQYEKVVVERA